MAHENLVRPLRLQKNNQKLKLLAELDRTKKEKENFVYRTRERQIRISENITCVKTCDFPFPNSGAMSKPAWTNLNEMKCAELQNNLLETVIKERELRP